MWLGAMCLMWKHAICLLWFKHRTVSRRLLRAWLELIIWNRWEMFEWIDIVIEVISYKNCNVIMIMWNVLVTWIVLLLFIVYCYGRTRPWLWLDLYWAPFMDDDTPSRHRARLVRSSPLNIHEWCIRILPILLPWLK